MSMRNWKKLAEEKAAVDRQTQAIHQKYRRHKINKGFSRLSGGELFKPITKRLDSAAAAEEENPDNAAENPDYAMDEFDRTNPFGEELRPDAPTPAPSPSPEPSPPRTPPPYQGVDDDVDDLPPLMEEQSARKEWGAPEPFEPEYSETIRLQTVIG